MPSVDGFLKWDPNFQPRRFNQMIRKVKTVWGNLFHGRARRPRFLKCRSQNEKANEIYR